MRLIDVVGKGLPLAVLKRKYNIMAMNFRLLSSVLFIIRIFFFLQDLSDKIRESSSLLSSKATKIKTNRRGLQGIGNPARSLEKKKTILQDIFLY